MREKAKRESDISYEPPYYPPIKSAVMGLPTTAEIQSLREGKAKLCNALLSQINEKERLAKLKKSTNMRDEQRFLVSDSAK